MVQSMQIGTNFWFMGTWTGEQPFKSSVNWPTAYVYNAGTGLSEVDIWNPVFLEEISIYTCLRFMDWGGTNWSKVESWSQRRLPGDPVNAEIGWFGADAPLRPGLAYEWMIDLCNRTKKDMWVCLPHRTNAEYWRSLADLIRDRLDPDLQVYVEYSNETWNGQFSQFDYTIAQGTAMNLPPTNNIWYQGSAFTVLQSLRIFEAFRDSFGGAFDSRVVTVVSAGGDINTEITALRNIYLSAQYNPHSIPIRMFAIAPYVGGSLDGASATVAESFHAGIESTYLGVVSAAAAVARSYGMRLGCYEGGQHLLNNAHLWSQNPAIYGAYIAMLDRFSEVVDLFAHYTHCGNWSSGGAWGAKNHTGQPDSEAHKYRALKDWIAANPHDPNGGGGGGGGPGGTFTLTPTDDRDSQSDNAAGTNATIHYSQYNTIYLRFDLSAATGNTVTSATLRIFRTANQAATTTTVYRANHDNWTQSGSVPGYVEAIPLGSLAHPSGSGWLEITLDPAAIQADFRGQQVVSLALTNTLGGWTGVSSREGAQPPQIVLVTEGENPQVQITTITLPEAVSGQAYSSTLQATGGSGTHTWSLQESVLPPGLSLAPSGVLGGIPAAPGDFDFTVRVMDGSGASAVRALRLSVRSVATVAWRSWLQASGLPLEASPSSTGPNEVPLLYSFAVGLGPDAPTVQAFSGSVEVSATARAFTFPSIRSADGLAVSFEISIDLTDWREAVSQTTLEREPTTGKPGFENRTYRFTPASPEEEGQCFGRLRFTLE